MSASILNSLSMPKYERLLPRLFPGAIRIEIRDRQEEVFWHWTAAGLEPCDESEGPENTAVVALWVDIGSGVARRELPHGQLQFRTSLLSRSSGKFAWLVVAYEVHESVPMSTATDALSRAFADVVIFIQEEIELQSECNQMAIELTERYEELNLVYSTQDQVDRLEEGQDALVRLVHNCADYLDVGMSALICRDRNLILQHEIASEFPLGVEEIIELLGTLVYDRVESQARPVVLNESDDEERERIFAGRQENLIAYPVSDNHGTTIGILAVVARLDTHTFSNGDRNLIEVMAKKASRIIHTHHDSLTGLMNRGGFESSMVSALSNSRSHNVSHCLLQFDIDQLHVVNDLMGHQEGDKLIRRVAKILRNKLRDSDSVARLGGDEFGVLLTNCSIERGHAIAEKIRNAISGLTVISARRQLDVTASIGIAAVTPESQGIVGVMASAEIACKAAKDAGRDRVQVFEQDNTTLVRRSEEIEWIGRVQQALRNDEFVLHAQLVMPIFAEVGPEHFEILLRMRDDGGKMLAPVSFLPAAERYQLMPMVDRWVIQNTLKSLSACWSDIEYADPVFCINLSGQSLTNPGFQSFVIDELQQCGLPKRNVCFEITETAAIANIDEATAFMQVIRDLGCQFSLDDFGAGLSSFGYLKVLPVDYLKIDGSFVRELKTDQVSLSMVDAICQIGRTMGLSTVAEFVGDDETVEILRKIGIDYVQGYGIGKPVPLTEIIQSLQSQVNSATA